MTGSSTTEIVLPPADPGPSAGDRRPYFLFVDDSAFIVGAVERVAGAYGLEVTATTSVGVFRERYRERLPDLIGFDLAMPDGDGIELMRFLAAEGCRVPILIITGLDRRVLSSAARLGRERGLNIVETLSKPFTVETLRAALGRMGAGALAAQESAP